MGMSTYQWHFIGDWRGFISEISHWRVRGINKPGVEEIVGFRDQNRPAYPKQIETRWRDGADMHEVTKLAFMTTV
jgi:hypothetical protein